MKITVLMMAGLISIGSAQAAETLGFAAPDPWVKIVPVPKPVVRDSNRSLQVLLLNEQDRLGEDGVDTFSQSATLIQTAQGLSDIGSVQFSWNPAFETPIVNHLLIRRAGKTIDVLQAGQQFAVLRREANLERAMLDGVLTAALQPEGLQTGDIVDFAYTIKRRDPVLRGHAESLFYAPLHDHPSHLLIREIWPASKTIAWKAGEYFARPIFHKTQAGTEFVIDMHDVDAPPVPAGAPPRYAALEQLELTDFADWGALARLFAPLYDKAATLPADPTLLHEIDSIAAASADPARRAEAALRLVQERIRYLFLGMNEGGLVPADAGTTWARRFGDCKGKTALLLGVLHRLGIEAVPALVSTVQGDGLDARVPTIGRFDHVIVRATIAGRTYWLDGTRLGDGALEKLLVPPFKWALPLAPSTVGLEPLHTPPLASPEVETVLHVDASEGLSGPAKLHGEITLHGEMAIGFHLSLSSASHDQVEAGMRQIWRSEDDAIEPSVVRADFNSATGVERLTMDGHLRLDWSANTGDGGRDLSIELSRASSRPNFDRPPGPHQDAPFQVPYPKFVVRSEDIVLPKAGVGLILVGGALDEHTDVAEWHRDAALSGGVLRVVSRYRALAPEVPASQVPALAATMRKLSQDVVFLHEAPAGAGAAAQDTGEQTSAQSKSATLIAKGVAAWKNRDIAGAFAAFNAAIKTDPSSGVPLALRGLLEIAEKQQKQADADIASAARLSPDAPTVLDAQATLAMGRASYAEAITFYTKSLALRPDGLALAQRARAHLLLGHIDDALRDYDSAIARDPHVFQYRANRWDILLSHGKVALALQEADALAAAEPRNAQVQYARAIMLFALSRKAEARVACQASIALSPTDAAYVEMARLQDNPASAEAMAYVGKALALNPNNISARIMRGRALMREKKFREAADDLSAALPLAPTDMMLLRITADALQMSQRGGQALPLIDRLVAMQPANAHWLNMRCWARATSGGDLAAALADCNAALRIDPGYAEALDSRGFVHLRRGELAAAKADYDAALRLRPEGATSLYGRAVALRRIGQTGAAESDLQAARRIKPDIDMEFAGYGVKL